MNADAVGIASDVALISAADHSHVEGSESIAQLVRVFLVHENDDPAALNREPTVSVRLLASSFRIVS